jgi:antitoxin CptB
VSESGSDRIAWRCRRGLLELDLWLGGFWTAQRATLGPDETAAFERLLSLSDMEITDRLQGRVPVGDADLEALLQGLRACRAQYFQDQQ